MNGFARSSVVVGVLICMPIFSFASVPTWHIQKDKSSLTFTATQNGAPVSGAFKSFDGEIDFDPSQLNASKVHIEVDMNSLTTSYDDLTTTLITPDWFNIKIFPKAQFDATHFTKLGDNHYQASGMLTIRDKTQPVVLDFTGQEGPQGTQTVTGSTSILRSTFGIGQGDWASTEEIKDIVKVDFKLIAVKEKQS